MFNENFNKNLSTLLLNKISGVGKFFFNEECQLTNTWVIINERA